MLTCKKNCTNVKGGGGVPSDDAASSPHESDGAVVEGPVELFGRLSQQHESLRVGNDLGRVESLQTQTKAQLSGSATAELVGGWGGLPF